MCRCRAHPASALMLARERRVKDCDGRAGASDLALGVLGRGRARWCHLVTPTRARFSQHSRCVCALMTWMHISWTLSGGTPPRRWTRRSAAVAAGGLLVAAAPVALPAWADQPPPVTAMSVSSHDAAVVDTGWSAPAGVSGVDVCWKQGPPA